MISAADFCILKDLMHFEETRCVCERIVTPNRQKQWSCLSALACGERTLDESILSAWHQLLTLFNDHELHFVAMKLAARHQDFFLKKSWTWAFFVPASSASEHGACSHHVLQPQMLPVVMWLWQSDLERTQMKSHAPVMMLGNWKPVSVIDFLVVETLTNKKSENHCKATKWKILWMKSSSGNQF